MTFQEKQAALAARINGVGDCFDQYAYLIALAAELPPMPECLRTEDRQVEGCQSRVWVHVSVCPDGTLVLQADSDTLIMKGILRLFADLIEGCRPEEVVHAPWDFLEQTELTVTFPTSRKVGIGSIVGRIRAEAARLSPG